MASKKFEEFASAASWAATWYLVGYDPAEGASVDGNKRVLYSALQTAFASSGDLTTHVGDETVHITSAQNAGLDASASPSAGNPYLTQSGGDTRYHTKTVQNATDTAQNGRIDDNEAHYTGVVGTGTAVHVTTTNKSTWDGKVDSVTAGDRVTVDNTDPKNPIVSADIQAHGTLTGRDALNQHPQSAITDLVTDQNTQNSNITAANDLATHANRPALDKVNDQLTDTVYLNGTGAYSTPPGGTDDKTVKVTTDDTTPKFLSTAITSNDASVTLTVVNTGGNRTLDLAASGVGGGQINTAENLGTGVELAVEANNGVLIPFRTFVDTTTVQWTQNANDVEADIIQSAISITASQVSDFDAEVTNNTTVVANTAKVSASGSIGEHSDVDITGVVDGQILKWATNKFVAAADETGSGAAADIDQWDIAARVDIGTGAYKGIAVADLNEQGTPAGGDKLLGWDGVELKVFDVGNLPQGGDGGGLTRVTAEVTTANLTAAIGNHYLLTVSNMTADRDFILPSGGTDGDEVGWELVTDSPIAPAPFELILKGAAGAPIRFRATNVAAETEVTSYFIIGESGRAVWNGTENRWVISAIDDGRIPQQFEVRRTTDLTVTPSGWTDIEFDNPVGNLGGVYDTTDYSFTPRRSGSWLMTMQGRPVNLVAVGVTWGFKAVNATAGEVYVYNIGPNATQDAATYPILTLTETVHISSGDNIVAQVYNQLENFGLDAAWQTGGNNVYAKMSGSEIF